MVELKMNGIVKWYNKNKGYGYIIGSDEELYYYDVLNIVDDETDYETGDKVKFIPNIGEIDYATKVEKYE